MRSCEVEQVFSNPWDCVAEWSRALVLGSSHFNDVGSSSTTARVQVVHFFSLFSSIEIC